MQFTDLLIPLKPACSIGYENPPNKSAKMTRQNILPCNLLDSPARITRRIYSPEKSAISTRGLVAREPPFPA
jgi:hypothetical protein